MQDIAFGQRTTCTGGVCAGIVTRAGHWAHCTLCNSYNLYDHTGGSQENGGRCVICGYGYIDGCWHEWKVVPGQTSELDHMVKCSLCGTEGAELHTGGDKDHSGRCSKCYRIYQTHSTMIAHDRMEGTGKHKVIVKCTVEGCPYQEIMTEENCYGFEHPNGQCKACGAVGETHQPTTNRVGWDMTSNTHTPIYACSKEGCMGQFKGTVSDDHTWETLYDNRNGTHSLRCTTCGYTVKEEHDYNKEEQKEHENKLENSKGAATGASLLLEIGEELGAEEIIDESCSKCGALASAEENGCEHTYVEKNDENQHWEECTKCGYYKKDSLETHDYTTYTDNGNGTHSTTCTKCEYKETKDHYFVDGKCSECEAKPLQNCEHKYILKGDETKHWAQCSECNNIKSITLENHEYGTYINNNDGTHSVVCKICAYVFTEKHEENCEKCETIIPPDSENGDEEGEDKEDNKEDDKGNTTTPETGEKEDNTIADVIIPAAGSPMLIALVIVILGAVIGIIKLKLKNYKDI